MRLAGLAAALAVFSGGSGPSLAASQDRIATSPSTGTVPVAPLGPDEVLLELQVSGVSNLPAEVTTVSMPIARSAPTPAAARAALSTEADRISAAARKAGIEARDIRIVPRPDPRLGVIGWEVQAPMGLPGDAGALQAHQQTAAASVEIVLRDPARFEALRNAVETAETMVPMPVYSLRDPGRGEREAKADALRRARAEAEDYARRIGMRVGRLIRIGSGQYGEYLAAQAMMRMMMQSTRTSATVETTLIISVDYALVPEAEGAPKP